MTIFNLDLFSRHYLLSLSGLAVENTAWSAAVAEETLSKLVTSVLKLEANCLGVEVLASEQSRAIDGSTSARAVTVRCLEPVGLGGGGRWVPEGRLELAALVGACALVAEVVSPGLWPPVSGGEPDADVGVLVLGDEDGAEGGLVLFGGQKPGAGR